MKELIKNPIGLLVLLMNSSFHVIVRTSPVYIVRNPAPQTCSAPQVSCNDGSCIMKAWVCDGDKDCLGGDDEQNCSPQTCSISEWSCDNGACIPDRWVCDGAEDCTGGEDEQNCTTVEETDVCSATQFSCGNRQCILKKLRCDNKEDCENGLDERNCTELTDKCDGVVCGENKLDNHTNDCECLCDSGFEWNQEEKICTDIDECLDYKVCSQKCLNRYGVYECECVKGYTKENQSFCRAEGERAWLYLANSRDIRRIREDSKFMEMVISDTKSSVALDLDYEENLLFWTDLAADEIKSASMQQPSSTIKTLVKKKDGETFSADGLAVDWLFKHVYWTDTGTDTIKVANYDGMFVKTLIDTDLDEPRAICLDPEDGYMYWSDWGNEPKIERSGMDGSSREVLIQKDNGLGWPNGLTIDYIGRRIYWIDSKLHQIGTSKLDGSDIDHVLVDATEIVHPFSIAVFEDSLYWTDWQSNSIKSVNKLTGQNLQIVITESFRAMDVKVYQEKKQSMDYKQTANAMCKTASCKELCLPKPEVNRTTVVVCACSDGKVLWSDKKSCGVPVTDVFSKKSTEKFLNTTADVTDKSNFTTESLNNSDTTTEPSLLPTSSVMPSTNKMCTSREKNSLQEIRLQYYKVALGNQKKKGVLLDEETALTRKQSKTLDILMTLMDAYKNRTIV